MDINVVSIFKAARKVSKLSNTIDVWQRQQTHSAQLPTISPSLGIPMPQRRKSFMDSFKNVSGAY